MKKLNKFISDAGYCSRREADKYIEQGRVTVNGADAAIGSMVAEGDLVEVDGERVGKTARRAVYMAFNKPVGVTSTTDRADKTNIIDFINYRERIFPVGRLDKDSEGLIILTNDGDIVNKILRAGNNNPKEYVVTVDKPVTSEFLRQMSQGVRILGVKTKPCKVVRQTDTTFVIYLTQGLNRQIRRMCQTLDYKVTRLKRVKVMNISLGHLETGSWRFFTPSEISDMQALLEASVGTQEASNEQKPKTKGNFTSPAKKIPPKAGSYAAFKRKSSGKKPSAQPGPPAGKPKSPKR